MYLTANRGMFLETLINYTINEYRNKNIGLFYKRPVDIVPIEKDKAIINKAYFKEKSTCDYYGLYQGHYLEFEAKETKKTKFSLNTIKEHQLKQLSLVQTHHGLSFIIVYFSTIDRYFILSYQEIKKWQINETIKQIPISYFEEYGYELFISFPHLLDFQNILNQLINCT